MEKFTATALLLAAILWLSLSAARPIEEGPGMDVVEPQPTASHEQPKPDHHAASAPLDTLPKGKFDFHSHKNGKEVKAKIRDQKIVRLEIDGEEIPEKELAQYEEMVEELISSVPERPRPPAPPALPTPPAAPAPPAPPAPGAAPAPPVAPVPPAPPAPRGFPERQEINHITAIKQDDGRTAITIEKMDGEKIELLVADDDDGPIIYFDGEELEDGKTRVVVEEKEDPFFHFRKGGEHQEQLWIEKSEAHREAYEESMEHYRQERRRISEEMRKAQEELRLGQSEERERLINQLRAQQESMREQTRAAMEQHREQMRQNRDEVRRQMKEQSFRFSPDGNAFFFSTDPAGADGGTTGALERQLLADGLIESADSYKFELSGKGWVKAEGKKYSGEVYEKYRALWEAITGENVEERGHIRVNKKSQAQ